jgi:hypothetical protein
LRLRTLPAPCHRREPAASSLLGPTLSLTVVLLLPPPHHRHPACVPTATALKPPLHRALVIGEACDRPPSPPTRLSRFLARALCVLLTKQPAGRTVIGVPCTSPPRALHPRKGLQLRRRIVNTRCTCRSTSSHESCLCCALHRRVQPAHTRSSSPHTTTPDAGVEDRIAHHST